MHVWHQIKDEWNQTRKERIIGMDVSTTIKKFGLEQAFKYLHKDPEKNLVKIMDWADKFAGNEFVPQRRMIREAMTNPKHPYYGYIRHILEDIDPHVM